MDVDLILDLNQSQLDIVFRAPGPNLAEIEHELLKQLGYLHCSGFTGGRYRLIRAPAREYHVLTAASVLLGFDIVAKIEILELLK